MSGRSCGGCNACCSALAISELDKPAGKLCSAWRTGSGCSRYATRPEACRRFRCLWLDGLLPDRARPDKSGVLAGLKATTTPFDPEVWPEGGGALRRAVRDVSERTGRVMAVVVTVLPGAEKPRVEALLDAMVGEAPLFIDTGAGVAVVSKGFEVVFGAHHLCVLDGEN